MTSYIHESKYGVVVKRELRDFMVGVISLVFVAISLYLGLGVGWWPSIFIASVIGISLGLLAEKLQGGILNREKLWVAARIFGMGIVTFALVVEVLRELEVISSPASSEVGLALLGGLFTLFGVVAKLSSETGEIKGKFGSEISRIDSSISDIKEELGEIDKKLERLNKIESKLDLIWEGFKEKFGS